MPPPRQSRSTRGRHLSLVPSRGRYGLCGNRDRLTQTECCQEWICDDAYTYELFSDARNRCYQNHGRFTRCRFRNPKHHRGEWKTGTQSLTNLSLQNPLLMSHPARS
jgi:hypothetical protein